MPIKIKKIKDIKPDTRNANVHSDVGMELLGKSLQQNKFGRSILISNDDVVIAGNGTVEKAGELGYKELRVIETDGNELIAIKRTDIASNSPEFFKMALADNIVSQKNIVMDAEVIEAIATEFAEVEEWKEQIMPSNHNKRDGEGEIDLSEFDVRAQSYLNGAIRQINLFFSVEGHTKALNQLAEIGEYYKIENNNTAIVEQLIKHWYDTIGNEKKKS